MENVSVIKNTFEFVFDTVGIEVNYDGSSVELNWGTTKMSEEKESKTLNNTEFRIGDLNFIVSHVPYEGEKKREICVQICDVSDNITPAYLKKVSSIVIRCVYDDSCHGDMYPLPIRTCNFTIVTQNVTKKNDDTFYFIQTTSALTEVTASKKTRKILIPFDIYDANLCIMNTDSDNVNYTTSFPRFERDDINFCQLSVSEISKKDLKKLTKDPSIDWDECFKTIENLTMKLVDIDDKNKTVTYYNKEFQNNEEDE